MPKKKNYFKGKYKQNQQNQHRYQNRNSKFIKKLQNENKVKLIGINYKDNKKNALKFIEELSNPFDKIVSDKNGTLSIKLGAYGVPESFLIDQDKKILKKIVGPIDQKSYFKIIEILNETN